MCQGGAPGLYQVGVRHYEPDGGRFTQQRPLPSLMFTNRYAYAGGNPVNYSDSTCLIPASCPRFTRIWESYQLRVKAY